ncbi:MAG: hypothetical protein MH472_11805 [Bacteroidia bacterium]|nr:hypothetical protein [Bacteroidia bacterium]
MTIKKVYQTLEDRSNPDYVEDNGPFPCNRKNAWLGNGYYFWDSFIENAHWWGIEGAKFTNGYFICEAHYDFDETLCFNLIDNPLHFQLFNNTKKIMQEKGLYVVNQTTVARIIEYIKNTLNIFKYHAIRVYGINSKSFNSPYSNRTIFDNNHNTKYLDSLPAIQICFYSKSSLNLREYRLIYPPEYSDDYLV